MKNLKKKIKKIIIGISALLISAQTKVLAVLTPLYAPVAPDREKSFIDKILEFVKTFFIPIIAIISLLIGLFVYLIIKRKDKKNKN